MQDGCIGALAGVWAYSPGWELLPLALLAPPLLVAVLLLVAPYTALRLTMAVLSRSLFWLRCLERRRLPAAGAVLVVASGVSYLGRLFYLSASPRRLRFLVLSGWAGTGFAGFVMRRLGAVVPNTNDAAGIEDALRRAGEALDRGEAVCVCAEGVSAGGDVYDFGRIYRAVVGSRKIPTVPVALHQPHGSLLSIERGAFVRRWPAEIPAPVWTLTGTVLPPGATAAEARQALQETSAELAKRRSPHRRPVHRQFVRMAASRPFRLCWVDSSAPGQDMTYGKAFAGSVCLSQVLRPLLGEAKMVAVWLPPGRGSGLTNIALTFLGKISVNLNYTAGPEAIRSSLRQCGCTHVVTAKRFVAKMPLDAGPGVEVVFLEDLLPKVTSWMRLRAFLACVLLPGWFLERYYLGLGGHTKDDVVTIIFSSGSTGEPKGVTLTHDNVAANAESMIQGVGLGPSDRVLGVLPFFHSFGFTVTFWGPLQVGAAGVYHADPRQAREIGELCKKNRCTIYLSTATFLRFCLRKCEADDFKSLRILVCGAEKLPPSFAEEFGRRFGIVPLEGYGCTELSPVVSTNVPDEPFAGLTQLHNRTGTVGAPLPGIAVRVVDPDTRRVLPLGEEGMIEATGANVMLGYLNKPEMTAGVVRDGWYLTGDMAKVGDDGHITITGRLSRFAKIGGEMVPLEKIEEALHEVLDTGDRVCVVTCVPDDMRGERVVVLYVSAMLATFAVEVKTWAKRLGEAGMPNLWIPADRDFVAVEELPVLGSGKVNLKGVKEMALALFGR